MRRDHTQRANSRFVLQWCCSDTRLVQERVMQKSDPRCSMKIDEFKKELRSSLENICHERKWSFDNPKYRGMAFEDWSFNLFRERYPAAENNPEECIIR